jgi:hypothetical protein
VHDDLPLDGLARLLRARLLAPFWREAGLRSAGAPANLATAFERELESRQMASKPFNAFRN